MLESAHIQLQRHTSTTCLNSSRVPGGPEGTLSGRVAAGAIKASEKKDQRSRRSGEGGSSKMNAEGKLHGASLAAAG